MLATLRKYIVPTQRRNPDPKPTPDQLRKRIAQGQQADADVQRLNAERGQLAERRTAAIAKFDGELATLDERIRSARATAAAGQDARRELFAAYFPTTPTEAAVQEQLADAVRQYQSERIARRLPEGMTAPANDEVARLERERESQTAELARLREHSPRSYGIGRCERRLRELTDEIEAAKQAHERAAERFRQWQSLEPLRQQVAELQARRDELRREREAAALNGE